MFSKEFLIPALSFTIKPQHIFYTFMGNTRSNLEIGPYGKKGKTVMWKKPYHCHQKLISCWQRPPLQEYNHIPSLLCN